jgi:hypothetical protein
MKAKRYNPHNRKACARWRVSEMVGWMGKTARPGSPHAAAQTARGLPEAHGPSRELTPITLTSVARGSLVSTLTVWLVWSEPTLPASSIASTRT